MSKRSLGPKLTETIIRQLFLSPQMKTAINKTIKDHFGEKKKWTTNVQGGSHCGLLIIYIDIDKNKRETWLWRLFEKPISL